MSDQCSSLLKDSKAAGVSLLPKDDQVATDNVEEEDAEEGKGDDDLHQQPSAPFLNVKNISSDIFSGLSGAAKSQLGHISERLQNKLQAMSVSSNGQLF